MRALSPMVPAGIRAPAAESCLDVRNHSGDLVGRVPAGKAAELIAAGLVSPIGRNRVQYVVLNCDEPTLERPWRGGSRTTYRESVPAITGISKITQHRDARL